MANRTIGEFLQTLRKDRGLTQQEVADKLNVSNRTLSSWETDRTAPDLVMLPAVADLYGVTIDEILRGERRTKEQPAAAEPAEKAQPDGRRTRFEAFLDKSVGCAVLGVLGALLFIIGCVIMLYTAASFWLDFISVALGLGCNLAAGVCLVKFRKKAEDDGDDNAYKLALTKAAATPLICYSSAYIFGVILLSVLYYAYPYKFGFGYNLGNSLSWFDYYNAYTVCVCICLILGIISALSAAIIKIISIMCLGDGKQREAQAGNLKLFKKQCVFGEIPVALSAILFIIFSLVKFTATGNIHFTADGVDELYKTFQTITLYEDAKIFDEQRGDVTVIPKGEYYLNFQSENFVTCSDGNEDGKQTMKLYDLGNRFYGEHIVNELNDVYAVYYLKDGVAVDDINPDNDYGDYFVYYSNRFNVIEFESPSGEKLKAVIAGWYFDTADWYFEDYYYSTFDVVLEREGSVYTYGEKYFYDYSPLLGYITFGVTALTVTTCTVIQLIKRKKIKYDF